MKTISIALCEDNPASLTYIRNTVQTLLSSHGVNGIISSYSSSTVFSRLIRDGSRFQMYLLDIDMPEINGLELASRIRHFDKNAVILFVSAREEYVFEAIRVQPFRFIRKANYKADLSEAFQEYFLQKEADVEKNVLALEVQSETYLFNIDEIRYIQAKDNYLDVVMDQKKSLIRYRISAMEEKLSPYQFLRIHKSFLVNFKYIYVVRNKNVVLEDGTSLPVSRYRLAEVQAKFKEYLQCK